MIINSKKETKKSPSVKIKKKESDKDNIGHSGTKDRFTGNNHNYK